MSDAMSETCAKTGAPHSWEMGEAGVYFCCNCDKREGSPWAQEEVAIAEWQKKVYALAKEKGWWDGEALYDVRVIPEKIALIHSEASEALEVYRDSRTASSMICWYEDADGDRFQQQMSACGRVRKPVGFDSEMADVVIRVMDLCEHLGIDLERAIREKHAHNETRPRRHGGKRC